MESAAARDRRPFARALAPAAVAALTILVFLPALRNGFVNWDDQANLLANPHYRGLGWDNLRWMFTTFHLGHYQPLSWLTFAFDHALWGMDPAGYHLTAVLLHAANAALFYLLGLELLAGEGARPSAADRMAAAVSALLFSLHPLRVESVAWATERRDVLSGFFSLLAVLLWIKAVRAAPAGTRPKLLAALAAYLLALLSKVMVITLPAVLVLLDVYPLGRLPTDPRQWGSSRYRAVWLEKAPFFAAALVFAVVGLCAQHRWGATVPLAQAGAEHIAGPLFSLGFYLAKTVVPVRLSPVYQWRWASDPWLLACGGALALACAAACVFARRRLPGLLAAFLAYALILSPAIGLVQLGPQVAADRYTYLACLPWALLAGAGFRRWSADRRRTSLAAAAAVLTLLSLQTLRQTAVWRDSETLWRRVIAIDRGSPLARQNLATALYEKGLAAEAVLWLEEQTRLFPDDEDSRRILAEMTARTWDTTVDFIKMHNDAGVDLSRRGELEKAVWHFRRSLALDPTLWRTHDNLGLALYRQGRFEEAVREFEESVRLKPDAHQARTDLGIALARLGRLDEAVAQFEAALRLDPGYSPALKSLALARESGGRR